MWQWLRRSFLTGFFITVPLAVSLIALVWMFRVADRLTGGLSEKLFGRQIPGIGIIATAISVLAIGTLAMNVFTRRVLQQGEAILLRVPVFRTVYAPLKQLMAAFSPDNEMGFKRVVLVEDASRGFVLGFLTKEFALERGDGPEPMVAIYVPTNHLYLGDVIVCRRDRVSFPDLTVEQGVRIFLTGGVALPAQLAAGHGAAEHYLDNRGESAR